MDMFEAFYRSTATYNVVKRQPSPGSELRNIIDGYSSKTSVRVALTLIATLQELDSSIVKANLHNQEHYIVDDRARPSTCTRSLCWKIRHAYAAHCNGPCFIACGICDVDEACTSKITAPC